MGTGALDELAETRALLLEDCWAALELGITRAEVAGILRELLREFEEPDAPALVAGPEA